MHEIIKIGANMLSSHSHILNASICKLSDSERHLFVAVGFFCFVSLDQFACIQIETVQIINVRNISECSFESNREEKTGRHK